LPQQTAVELSPVLAGVGAELMVRTLARLEQGTLHATPQDHSRATSAPILQREDGRVDWTRNAQEVFDRWRGFQPWPGAFTSFRRKKLILHAMEVVVDPSGPEAAPGVLRRAGNRLLVACGQSTWLDLLELQMEGKRRMPVAAFLNGLALAEDEQLDLQ
jgi:methionyl-tRNA formyltransferase